MYESVNGNSFTYTSSYGQVTKLTNITREFDEEGRLVKETETVTEYTKPFVQPAPYQPYQPQQPYWWYSSTIQSSGTKPDDDGDGTAAVVQ